MESKEINTLLGAIYSHIHPYNTEMDKIDKETFDLVDTLLEGVPYEGLIDKIYENSKQTDVRKIGILFDILTWSTKDNGTYLFTQIATWVKGNNKKKLEIALSVNDSFPLYPISELEKELKLVEKKFPDLRPMCEFWADCIKKKT
ncbi:MAG: hypothetical protein U0X91_17425 [Spirosomataceae bacterium]